MHSERPLARRTARRRAPIIVAVSLALALAPGCKAELVAPTPPSGVTLASLTVTSKAFRGSRDMPVDYSCDGAERSPPIEWSSPPEKTKSFAIVLEDSDSAGNPALWVLFNVSAEARMLAEGADIAEVGGRVGTNDANHTSYNGPCPPKHEVHRYAFHVFALDATLTLTDAATRATLYGALRGHVLAEGILVGVFSH